MIVWEAAAEARHENTNIQDFDIGYLVGKMIADAILASNDLGNAIHPASAKERR